MWVEVKQSALNGRVEDDLAVMGVLALCLGKRHRLFGDAEALTAWARRYAVPGGGAVLPDVVETLLEEGEGAHATSPIQEKLIVAGAPAQWTGPLTLPPQAALGLLARPLRLWLENGRNDWSFLLAFASPAQADQLERAVRAGWLVLSNGGGCGELKVLVEGFAKALNANRLAQRLREGDDLGEERRFFVVLDSDRKMPGTLPDLQDAVENGLCAIERALHPQSPRPGTNRGGADDELPLKQVGKVLRRREAENYIPPQALAAWNAPKQYRDRVAAMAKALEGLPSDFAAYVDVKHGARGTHPSIWNLTQGLSPPLPALAHGVGENTGSKFYEQHRARFSRTHNELDDLLARILERI